MNDLEATSKDGLWRIAAVYRDGPYAVKDAISSGPHWVVTVTSVADENVHGHEEVAALYEPRWGVDVFDEAVIYEAAERILDRLESPPK